MNKKFLRLSVLAIIFGMFFVNSNIQATEADSDQVQINEYTTPNGSEVIEYTYITPKIVDEEDIILRSPRYVPYSETVYTPTVNKLYKSQTWSSTLTNRSTRDDSITRSVTRTTFANFTVSGSYEQQLLVSKLGVKAEVSAGVSKSETISCTWIIPANTSTIIKYGNKVAETSGTILVYDRGVVVSRKNASAKYSYGDYADKTSTPI